MKLIGQVFLILLITTLVSCKKPPEFPTTPEISFVDISKKTVLKRKTDFVSTLADSVTISLYFKDGDGDLGRSQGDDNYFCKVLLKKGNEFVDIIDTTVYDSVEQKYTRTIVSKDGRFLNLNPDGRQGPLEGRLDYGPTLNFAYVLDTLQYTLKFQVYIKDNAGHTSNTIETPEVTVKLY